MIDYRALAAHGTTNERLRAIFTAERPAALDGETETKEQAEARKERVRDADTRDWWEDMLGSRLDANISACLENYRLYSAVDLAMEPIINKVTLPLVLYAQGKINVGSCVKELAAVSDGMRYVKTDDKGKQYIDLPRFIESHVNLVRSLVLRRKVALVNFYSDLWPYFKYEARGVSNVAKLRADALSQRMDIMADQFNYRHHDEQCYGDALKYGHVVDFPRAAWEVERQIFCKPVPKELEGEKPEMESAVVREGIGWAAPHPSRVFWDDAHELASLNSDTGISYIGYWDVTRFSDLYYNGNFFNRDCINHARSVWDPTDGLYQRYLTYFTQYNLTIAAPVWTKDLAVANDRNANIGFYDTQQMDAGVLYAVVYQKIIPRDFRVGTYPHPIWVRLVVAGEYTVIFAEIMPSTPGAYLGINEDDKRKYNVSFAHDVMAWQDQLNNLTTQLLLLAQAELLKIISINTDVIKEKTQVDEIRSRLSGINWSGTPIVIEQSFSRLRELGVEPEKAVTITETRSAGSIDIVVRSMIQLVAMAEKLNAVTPAEQGQPAPREISATEARELANTTSAMNAFHRTAIDDFRAAKKRILYESLIACSKSELRVPIVNRYTEDTIQKAGLRPSADDEEQREGPRKRTVIGSPRALLYDYIFTARDGDTRQSNAEAANTLMQLATQIINTPFIAQSVGKEKLFDLFNTIFRLSTAYDLVLEIGDGESPEMGQDQVKQLAGAMQTFQKVLGEMNNNLGAMQQELQAQKDINSEQEKSLDLVGQLQGEVLKIAKAVAAFEGREEVPYKDAPEHIRRQIETRSGFKQAAKVEYKEKPAAKTGG